MLSLILIIPWAAMWLLGGLWVVRGCFRLTPEEETVTGAAVGLVLEIWLANLLARVLPTEAAFWAAPACVLLVGLGLMLAQKSSWRDMLRVRIVWQQWLGFAVLFYILFITGQGLALFDDFQNLPIISQLAAGDIPPHFSMNPTISFSYHYFLLLFSGQVMRLFDVFPWTAFDVAHALVITLSALLVGLWARRITRSTLGGVLTSIFWTLCSGTRWLFLLLPPKVVEQFSNHITMIGSGAQNAPSLAEGLVKNWAVSGSGPIYFPFAFLSTIYPQTLSFAGISTSIWLILMVMLLTFNRWKGWPSALVSAVLLGAMGLIGEAVVVFGILGWVGVAIITAIRQHNLRLPRSLWTWLGVVVASGFIILLCGGVISTAFLDALKGFLYGTQSSEYISLKFHVTFPPVFVSVHLGLLSFGNFYQVVTALLDIGPILLGVPLLAAYGLKALRAGRWYEAALILGSFMQLGALFIIYDGSAGISATQRLYIGFLDMLRLFTFPLVWLWVAKRGPQIKIWAAVVGMLATFSGVLLLGIQMVAAQRPVISYFLNELDAKMLKRHWNQLEEGSLVFDPMVSRATTLFARPTNSNMTCYEIKPDWNALTAAPTPAKLLAFGFSYAYIDDKYWRELGPHDRENLMEPCVVVMDEVSRKDPEDLRRTEFRRLLDLRGCKP